MKTEHAIKHSVFWQALQLYLYNRMTPTTNQLHKETGYIRLEYRREIRQLQSIYRMYNIAISDPQSLSHKYNNWKLEYVCLPVC